MACHVRSPLQPQRMQFVIEPPPQSAFASGAISPDGRQLAFFRVDTHDTTELWTRPLDALEARRVDGTRGAAWQFWSPDGRAIGFFAGDVSRRLRHPEARRSTASASRPWRERGSGRHHHLRSGSAGRTLSWASTGGAASQLTTPASTSGEISHRWPHFCRTGDVTCSCPGIAQPARRALYVGFLNGEAPRRLGSIESAAVFAPPLCALDQWWDAVCASLRSRDARISGSAQVVANGVNHGAQFRLSAVSASRDGAVVYHPFTSGDAADVVQPWRAAHCRSERRGSYGDLSLAPDERRLALTTTMPGGPSGVWQLDLQRRVLLTSLETPVTAPIWSPMGKRLFLP